MAMDLKFLALVAYFVQLASAATTPSPTPTPYQALPPAPTYPDGVFMNPNTAATQIFSLGSRMNITWSTSYSAVNLYMIGNASWGEQAWSQTLTTGQSEPWFLIEVERMNNNCDVAYNFPAVNAYGSGTEQADGGFWSGQFWIDPGQSTSTSIIANPTTTGTPTTVTTTPSTVLQPSTPTSNLSNVSVMHSTASPASITTSSHTPNSEPSANQQSSTMARSTKSSINSTSIGIGIGGGLVAAAIVSIASVWFWRRRRRMSMDNPWDNRNPQRRFDSRTGMLIADQMKDHSLQTRDFDETPSEMYAYKVKSLYEAPAGVHINELASA